MILKNSVFKKCEHFILNNGRSIEQLKYDCLFLNEDPLKYIKELKKYQNLDGGFGHGLEPDAITPHSSPFQTTVGLSYLKPYDGIPMAEEMISKAIRYLEDTYDKDRNGWYALFKDVNDYPHTPWWEYNYEDKMTPIDHHYGNPTASVVSYLLRYQQFVKKLNVEKLVDDLLTYIETIDTFISEHEIYCFLDLYEELSGSSKERLEKMIQKAVLQLVNYEIDTWTDSYVPQPIHFVSKPNMTYFGIKKENIDANLDFVIKQLEENHKLIPPWGASFYQGEFKKSYDAWVVIRTLETLIILKNFNKIEM